MILGHGVLITPHVHNDKITTLMATKETKQTSQLAELSKYLRSESMVLNRSQIHFADYNPRTIDEEHFKTLKRGIKKYGMVGGIVINKQTGYTVVQGHQRIQAMDELQKYDPVTHEGDYSFRCEVVDVDEKTERDLVILLNNPNAQGKWDYERLRGLVNQDNYKDVGFTDADLSMIGVDFVMPTVGDPNTAAEISQMILPDLLQTAVIPSSQTAPSAPVPAGDSPAEYEAKKQHMKDVKAQVQAAAVKKVANEDAYLMLSFDNVTNLRNFLLWLDLPADTQIIKGEELATMFQDMDEGGEDYETE